MYLLRKSSPNGSELSGVAADTTGPITTKAIQNQDRHQLEPRQPHPLQRLIGWPPIFKDYLPTLATAKPGLSHNSVKYYRA
jgi:hypothetical protein